MAALQTWLKRSNGRFPIGQAPASCLTWTTHVLLTSWAGSIVLTVPQMRRVRLREGEPAPSPARAGCECGLALTLAEPHVSHY